MYTTHHKISGVGVPSAWQLSIIESPAKWKKSKEKNVNIKIFSMAAINMAIKWNGLFCVIHISNYVRFVENECNQKWHEINACEALRML